MSTSVAEYYQHWGFVKTDSNELKYLPEIMSTWYQQAKKEEASTPFVYFVFNEELVQDALCNKENPDAPEVQDKFMFLLKLECFLKVAGNSADVKNPMAVQHCLPNPKDSSGFLQFPFSDTRLQLNSACSQLNSACSQLFLFDHLWFKFKESKENALWAPIEDSGPFKTVLIYVESYQMIRDNVMDPNPKTCYMQWLGGNHINFFPI